MMSKLRAAGMRELDIYKAVTMTPARLIGESEPRGLVTGAIADLTLLNESCAEVVLEDTVATHVVEKFGLQLRFLSKAKADSEPRDSKQHKLIGC